MLEVRTHISLNVLTDWKITDRLQGERYCLSHLQLEVHLNLGENFNTVKEVKYQKKSVSEAAEIPEQKTSENQAGRLGRSVWSEDTSAYASRQSVGVNDLYDMPFHITLLQEKLRRITELSESEREGSK